MIDHLTVPASGRNPDTLKSESSLAGGLAARTLFGGVLDSLQRETLRLAGRGSVSVRIYTGSNILMPPFVSTFQLFDEIESSIQKCDSETAEVPFDPLDPLDSLARPAILPSKFDAFWERIQCFYHDHLQWVNKLFR